MPNSVVRVAQTQRWDQPGVRQDGERPLLGVLEAHPGRAEEDGDHAIRARVSAHGAGGAVNMQGSHDATLPHPSDIFCRTPPLP